MKDKEYIPSSQRSRIAISLVACSPIVTTGCLAALLVGAVVATADTSVTFETNAPHPLTQPFAKSQVIAAHPKIAKEKGIDGNLVTDTVQWTFYDAEQSCFAYDFNQVFYPGDDTAAPYTDPRTIDVGFFMGSGDPVPLQLSDIAVDETEIIADRWPHQVESGSVTRCYPSKDRCEEMRTEPTFRTVRRRTTVLHVRGTGTMCASTKALTKKTDRVGIQLGKGFGTTHYQWNLK